MHNAASICSALPAETVWQVYADIYQANGTINPGELRITSYAGGPFDRSAQERWDMMGRIWQPLSSQVCHPCSTTPPADLMHANMC